MSLIDISCLCIFLVFAHLSESRVLILRDYDNDDVPLVLDHGGRSTNEEIVPKQAVISKSSSYRPKKKRNSKKTISQYGRHVYHFDDFDDLQQLRSKISELKKPLKDGSFSYDYVDITDFKSIGSAEDGVGEYSKDLLILSETPLYVCNGDDCEVDRKTFRKFDDHKDWKHDKNANNYIKRFEIVERHQSKKKPKRTTEKNHKKKKTSKKHKKEKDESSESMNSEERSSESWESNKKNKYSSDKNREHTKKHENIPKIKKKHKKKNYDSSGETERKTIAVAEDYFMQGNKIFPSKDKKKKKRHEYDGRRRLEHFLPKRYHWQPEEIHQLGYFWFNGPKGAYPAPRPL